MTTLSTLALVLGLSLLLSAAPFWMGFAFARRRWSGRVSDRLLALLTGAATFAVTAPLSLLLPHPGRMPFAPAICLGIAAWLWTLSAALAHADEAPDASPVHQPRAAVAAGVPPTTQPDARTHGRTIRDAVAAVVGFWMLLYILGIIQAGGGPLLVPIGGMIFLPMGLVWIMTMGVAGSGAGFAPMTATFWAAEALLHYLFLRTRRWAFFVLIVVLTSTAFAGCVALMQRLPTNPFM